MSPTIVRKEGCLDAKEVKIMRNSLLNMVLTTKFGDRGGKIHQNAPNAPDSDSDGGVVTGDLGIGEVMV